jgi:hypothetical protein
MNTSPVLSSNGSPAQESVKKRLEALYYLRQYPPVLNMRVVKMTNIPFDISTEEIKAFFNPLRVYIVDANTKDSIWTCGTSLHDWNPYSNGKLYGQNYCRVLCGI